MSFQLRILDVTRTGQCFGTWLFTDPTDYRTGSQQHAHPTMPRLEAIAYWAQRGFSAHKIGPHEYVLKRQGEQEQEECAS